ncbi:Tim44-like domain-containing protein [Gillisia sp. M10.2A]|uniref:Tim44-like domain-containing protein n=1 Tax=Gillisia lutea TaxID=2909668 RepID=A0ABS9EGA7_9FLAO|nr:Tim44-like domain-containing protein [Gillisia lutea]MCF4101891.1 Tim44-like domain-containing protein [Gillisia lutea]
MKNIKARYVLLIILLLSVELVNARAGGRSYSFGHSGPYGQYLFYLSLPLLLFFWMIKYGLIKFKKSKAERLLTKIESEDQIWNSKNIAIRVNEAFYKVQEAWMARDQNIAKNYMSQKIYDKHKLQTDELIKKGWINVLENVKLHQSTIISVKDFINNKKDTFSVLINASMVDYHINEKTKQVTEGVTYRSQDFEEIWHFIRIDNNWCLDKIYSDINGRDLVDSKSFKEIKL